MLKKKFYQGLSERETKQKIAKLGFDPLIINDPPLREYTKHKHPEDKLLAILEGSMIVWVKMRDIRLQKTIS